MHFKLLLFILVFILFTYFLIGILTTLILRATNPLNKITNASQILYLTFDDGIDSIYTPLLLDLLKKYNLRATFFILASSAKENPQILKRMSDEGHLIGLHSFRHHNQILQFPHQIKKDFAESMKIFQDMHINISFYRPPWGHVSPYGLYLCKTYGLKVVLWTVIIQDWQKDTSADILSHKLTQQVHGNAVICLHDGRGKNEAPLKTIKALETMLPLWQKEDYTFETVDELFKKSFV